MNQIDQTIARLCPNGVPFKLLGEIGTFVRGNGLQKKDFTESGAGCIHYGQIHMHYRTWALQTIAFVTPTLARRLRHAHTGDLVIATTSEDDDAVGKAVAWLGTEEVAVSGDAYIYRHSLDPKYVAYFFQTAQFSVQKQPHIIGTKVRRISGENLAKIRIPVPPVDLQRQIVEVLDEFAELEAKLETELEAEWEARRTQYQYYRDSLLSFDEQTVAGKQPRKRVRWVALNDLGVLYGGLTGKSKSDFQAGTSRFVSYMNVLKNARTVTHPDDFVLVKPGERQSRVRLGDVLFTASSETPDEVGMSSAVTQEPSEALYLNSFCFGFRPNDPSVLVPDFAKHLFRSATMRTQIVRTASGVTRFNVSKQRFRHIRVPIPPTDEQIRIAAILDKFEALVSDLSIRLPAELNARRQQYYYYRDRLFSFPEAA